MNSHDYLNRLLTKDQAIFLRNCLKVHLDFYTELLGTGFGSEKSRAKFQEMSQLDQKLKAYL